MNHDGLNQYLKWSRMGKWCSDGCHDSFPWFGSKNRSESFGSEWIIECTAGVWLTQLRAGHSIPPSFSNDRANGHQSTHNITIKLLSAKERFMFRIGKLLPMPIPLHHSAYLTQWTASQWVRVKSGRTNDRDEQERTATWNQVGLFLLKSRSF